ncbi:neutral/alkaline non-lysosomal ceramidase N-terminal domain-containing protein [Singulisphaera sp. PoT]|uniref:neutral/alkaline non-lysosomal ceramidase N-terminal domain-containing protein n=1 Tax=Singulisphaera sp. PoT TaxID=3411797 RepID=UPI003BF5D5FA
MQTLSLRRLILGFAGLFALAGQSGLATSARARELDVGLARVDITPDYPIRLSGYGARTKESVGVAQRIWAKAIAIGSDQDGPSLLVSVDNLGVPDAVVEAVAARLLREAKIPRERFVVASSHTHSAPCLTGAAPNIFSAKIPDDQQATIDRYTRELTEKLGEVSLASLKVRKPGLLSWSQGRAGFAFNRRTKGGPVDHALPVLRVTDPRGKIVGILINYACHCTTVSPNDNTLSGDWAGFAQEDIERDHPGAIAMTVVGCGADADPTPRLTPESAPAHGKEIAAEVNRLLKGEWTDLPTPPIGKFRRVKVPFDTLPTRAQLEQMVKGGGHIGYNASTQLARLDRGEPLQEALDYPVQTLQFGDRLGMIFLAGEVVVDYSLRLRSELATDRLWITAYANDVPCYIPSERILREGGYEGGGAMLYYGRPTRLKPGIESIIVSTVLALLPDDFRAQSKGADNVPPPKSPEDSLRSIRTKPGLRVELVASEPLVFAPVAIDFAADGSLWVAEMRDYPTGIDRNWKPGGVIKNLRDTDGDGRYDAAANFLEDVAFPTGVMAWRKGVLICSAPDIIYAEDTDGDGKADIRRSLFKGFSDENYQARVNGLSYNLDNWVYGANGHLGGVVKGTISGREVDIGGRDFRFHPDTGAFEPAAGLTQQGRVHDDWGNQFGNNNSNWLLHYPMPEQYTKRNPRVASPSPVVDVPRHDESHRLFPQSRTLERYNDPWTANQTTSACGPCIYRDSLLGAEYAGNAFTCEPVHNVVHREILDPDGVTFAGRRADDEQTSEFLASTDNWFRPVQVRTGPDGALYVVDMYRFVIEHPRWISPDRLAKLDVRAGEDKGRIYRVVPESHPLRPVPDLDRLATPALAKAIDSPNGTLRDNVQRLLVHRGGVEAVPALETVAASSQIPEARAQALGALDGLNALAADRVRAALADPHPGVRRQAIRLAGSLLGKDAGLGEALLARVDDPEIPVRFQLALTLGEWDSPRAGEALGKLALAKPADNWVSAAILSSASRQSVPILAALATPGVEPETRSAMDGPLIATLIGSGDAQAFNAAIASIARPEPDGSFAPWRLSALAVVLDSGAHDEAGLAGLRPAVEAARRLAVDPEARPADREMAVRLLGWDEPRREADREVAVELLEPQNPQGIQSAAIRILARLGDRESAEGLLSRWSGLGPITRSQGLDALMARPNLAGVLLSAFERGTIAPAEIDAAHRQRLINHEDADVRSRATRLLASAKPRARQAVVDASRAASKGPGDPIKGEVVFSRICATCHKFAGKGSEVGPDLAALTDKTPEALRVAIIDPNREVDARYADFAAALKDGRVVTGLIASETGNSITLKRQQGQVDVILRADLEDLKTAGRSLMPEGLEEDLKGTDLADLMAYIASGGDRPKALDGNHPEMANQGADGSIRLAAATAEVYGETLTFESGFNNLGYWHSDNDRAVWTVNVARPTSFTVSMEWACADESAGNRFRVRVGGTSIGGNVGGTGPGAWDNYRSIFIGEVTLPAGTHRLEFRSAGPIRNALLDLRTIVLTPRPAEPHDAVSRR